MFNARSVYYVEVKVQENFEPVIYHLVDVFLSKYIRDSPMISKESKASSPKPDLELLKTKMFIAKSSLWVAEYPFSESRRALDAKDMYRVC